MAHRHINVNIVRSVACAPSRTAVAALAGCAVMFICSSAHARDILQWANPSGGAASNLLNWSPTQIPDAADDLVFGLIATYSVSFSSAVSQTDSWNFNVGHVTITAGSGHSLLNTGPSMKVADTFETAAMTFTSGQLNAAGNVEVGCAASGTGVLDVTGFGANLFISGAFGLDVGRRGDGTVHVTSGGSIDTNNGFIGGDTTGVGVVNVQGTTGFPAVRSRLLADALTVGVLGDGELNITEGGSVDVAGNLTIGPSPGGQGEVTVGVPGAILNPRLLIGGDLLIARNSFPFEAGIGILNVENGGTVIVDGVTRVGDPQVGGGGMLNVRTGGLMQTTSLICDFGSVHLQHTGGSLIIDDGTFLPPSRSSSTPGSNRSHTVNSAAEDATLILRNGANATLFDLIATNSALLAGTTGSGEVILESNSIMSITPGGFTLGSSATGSGSLKVRGGAALYTEGISIVGGSGEGVMTVGEVAAVRGGAPLSTHSCVQMQIGKLAGSEGALNVLQNGQVDAMFLGVGGGYGGPGGTGSLNIDDGGIVNVFDSGSGSGSVVWPGSTMFVGAGSMFSSDADLHARGTLNLEGGTIEVNSLSVGALTQGHGVIDGGVSFLGGAGGVITASGGPLTFGNAAITNGYTGTQGTLNIGAQTVTILDADASFLGNTTITGGTLIADAGLSIVSGRTLSGNGSIDSPTIINNGTIFATGAGLAFNGVIQGIGQGVNGGKLSFAAGSGFTGSGHVNGTVSASTGSIFTATGPLTLGDGTNSGVGINGDLFTNGNNVTLLDANGCTLGGIIDLGNGAEVQCDTGIAMTLGAILRGTGVLDGSEAGIGAISNAGRIEPGNELGDRTQSITLEGNFSQASLGRMKMQIAGVDAASHDSIHVVGNATLNGTLEIAIIDGFCIAEGGTIPILTVPAGKVINGTFSSLQPAGLFTVNYGRTQVSITLDPDFVCEADVNKDTFVNVTDLLAVISAWGRCINPFNCPADVAPGCGDNLVNVTDLLAVISAWGICP